MASSSFVTPDDPPPFFRDPASFPVALLTVGEMYDADRRTIEGGRSGWRLMQEAGAAVADQALAMTDRGSLVVVLCGPGNNGGDGFVAASVLARFGRRVRVCLLGMAQTLKGDAALARDLWLESPGASIETLEERCLDDADYVIDALFGAGLNRAPEGAAASVLKAVKGRGLPCLAVDVPSGVDGNSGMAWEGTPECQTTVTFFRPKPGHYLYPGKALCGVLRVADIGIPDAVLSKIQPRQFINDPALWGMPQPTWHDHKYTRGHVQIFGSAQMSGAGRLAVRGARRVGAGLVSAVVPEEASLLYGLDAPGALIWPLPADKEARQQSLATLFDDPRRSVVVLGPGAVVGKETRDLALTTVRSGRSLVLDAGAITSFAGQPDLLFSAVAEARETGGKPVVLTPHEGEFNRLFGDLPGEASGPSDRLQRARDGAAKSGAVIVLKGGDTVIAAPNGLAVINPLTEADLATGGSGDVLAGMIGGLLGQGMDGFSAASAAVWLHSEVARRFGAGLLAEDIAAGIPAVLNDLRQKN